MPRNLQKDQKLFEMYDQVILEQLAEGEIERVTEEVNLGQQEFWLLHKAVIPENAERTKLWTVYDASVRENSRSFPLNDCLETGPALQNLLWSVLIRTRFKPTALCGDLQKAFLQIGQYALFIPWRSILAVKIVHEAHKRTMNGGVISTMAALREKYWITKLQQLTKRVIRNCFGCKPFQVNPFATPLQGQLPIDRTTGSNSF